MRAMLMKKLGSLKYVEIEVPQPTENELLIKITHVEFVELICM